MIPLYIRSDNEFREATGEEIIAQARERISRRFRAASAPLTRSDLTKDFLCLHLGPLVYEIFGVLYLDSRHRLIKAENLFRGTLDNATVPVREVVHAVINHRAAAVILYHNHPSGAPTPSPADEAITQRIQKALALIDVTVLDHLIVGERVFSFAEAGLL